MRPQPLAAYYALGAATTEAERAHIRAWRATWYWNIDNGVVYDG